MDCDFVGSVMRALNWACELEREVIDAGSGLVKRRGWRFTPGRCTLVRCARCRKGFDPMKLDHGMETECCPTCGNSDFPGGSK